MSLSQLDPVAALVVIDLQKGVLAIPTEPPTSVVLERSARLAAAFRAKNLPSCWSMSRAAPRAAPRTR
jgi:nicotinamidase-related amidase